MGDFVEYSAKNKSEAITKACIDQGVSSDELEIQVVSEGSSGFFGIGSKPAIIRVRRIVEDFTDREIRNIVENVSSEKLKEDEQRLAQKIKNQEKKALKEAKKTAEKLQGAAEKAEKAVLKEIKKAAEEKEAVQKAVAEAAEEAKETKEEVLKEAPEKENRPVKERRERSRNRGPRDRKHDRPKKDSAVREEAEGVNETAEAAEKPEKPEKVSKPVKILTDEQEIAEVENRAKVFLTDVFASMDLGEVEIKSVYNKEEGALEVDFEGEDMGVLIGKRGQTLDSLQYLTSLVVNKGKDDYIRVKLDTEDYRRRRKETLENLARGIAYKVKKTRRPVVLEPMNPYERRIIHSSLQGNKFVETVSEGEEPYRHVVVKLKR